MGGYRIEVVWRVLQEEGARLVPESCGLNYATWVRVVDSEPNIGAVGWGGRGGHLLFGDEIRGLAEALRLDPDQVMRRVEDLGGLWRDPRAS